MHTLSTIDTRTPANTSHPAHVTRRAKKVVPRFLGGKMTPEIKAALPHLSGITTEHARGVIKLVTDNIKGSDFTAEQAEEMAGALETDVSQRWV